MWLYSGINFLIVSGSLLSFQRCLKEASILKAIAKEEMV
jgi:hypothetical protein